VGRDISIGAQHHGRALFAPPPGRVILLWLLRGRKVTLELLHFDLGVVQDGMVGGLTAPNTKPFLQLRIPADVQMFHRGGGLLRCKSKLHF
jgi:hypothetical protein